MIHTADPDLLLEAALDSLPHGIALLDQQGSLAFWSQAAAEITGYARAELLRQPLSVKFPELAGLPPGDEAQHGHGALLQFHHKLGHELPVIARSYLLQDQAGDPVGTALLFHPAEHLDALPHGDGDQDRKASQQEFEERLRAAFDDFANGGEPLGVLWVAVDQGAELRKTHGMGACRSMIARLQHALAIGLRPADEVARWGEDEFLIVAHERTPEMLAAHGRVLAGLARTTDFRWWGDRIQLTVSIGAAQAGRGEPLAELLERAREDMRTAMLEGGNRVRIAHREAARGGEA